MPMMSRRSWRWTGVLAALALSLLANLFLAGLLLGQRANPDAAPARLALRAMLADTPPELRTQLRRSLFAERRALGAELRGAAQARQRIAALLEAPEPQREELEAAFAALQARHAASQRLLHGAFIDAILASDAQTRQRWAQSWRRPRAAAALRLAEPRAGDAAEDGAAAPPP